MNKSVHLVNFTGKDTSISTVKRILRIICFLDKLNFVVLTLSKKIDNKR